MPAFGRSLRPLWNLDPQGVFLNHGSFGACPKEVLAAQAAVRDGMERQPDVFFRRTVHPLEPDNALRQAAGRLGRFLNVPGESIAFVTNATEAVNTVLRSIALAPGDEIVLLDCAYGAVKLAARTVAGEHGARVVEVALPLPFVEDGVAGAIADAAGPRTRLAIIDHIASPTAVVLPVADIVRSLQAKGVRVLIDGAHAPGQVALDVAAIDADWYTGNAHKWLYAPKGCAFLHASASAAASTRPLAVSHYHARGFPTAFDYTGTRDVSSYLALPAALDFVERLGAPSIRAWNDALARDAVGLFARLGAAPVAGDGSSAAMRAFVLPQTRAADAEDAPALMRVLWDEARVQIGVAVFGSQLLARVSAQVYAERDDLVRGVDALERHGWPRR